MHESSQAASPALLRGFRGVKDSYVELALCAVDYQPCNRRAQQPNSFGRFANQRRALRQARHERFDRKDPTMETTPEQAIAALLRETETAHGAYETTVLGGVFDAEWPAWYATYLLDHGLRDLLPGAEDLDVDNLAAKLVTLAAEYERGEQTSPWPDVYAQGIVIG